MLVLGLHGAMARHLEVGRAVSGEEEGEGEGEQESV